MGTLASRWLGEISVFLEISQSDIVSRASPTYAEIKVSGIANGLHSVPLIKLPSAMRRVIGVLGDYWLAEASWL